MKIVVRTTDNREVEVEVENFDITELSQKIEDPSISHVVIGSMLFHKTKISSVEPVEES